LIFSGKMYRFRPAANLIDARFLEAFLQTSFAWSAIDAMKTGGSDSGLNLTHDRFRQLLVPLAPLNEQHRIAARIDALFADVAEGEAALAAVRKGLETFRRALLKAAISGELTKDWREANTPSEMDVGLLARLDNDNASRAPGKVRRRRTAESGWLDVSTLPLVPDGWAWAALAELAISGPTNGYSPRKSTDGSGTLALKLTATTRGQIDLSE
jgi:type I restriction enzyme S subunit